MPTYSSGVIELYEATLDAETPGVCVALAGERMLAKFYDSENGGFWQSPRTRRI